MSTWRRPTGPGMRTVLVDTSGFYALLDRDDQFHQRAGECWRALIGDGRPLVAHNYVLIETIALAQRRLGPAAVRVLNDDVFPSVRLFWVDEPLHAAGMTACLAAARRDISLVDWVSFELMRTQGVQQVFSFDEHFREQGFVVIPGST